MKKLAVSFLTILLAISSIGGSQVVDALSTDERVKTLMADMTQEEKVAQMIQADTRDITPVEVGEYKIGSILSGGGASAEGNNEAIDWANRTKEYQDAAITATGIPLLYGVDAVHGHNNVYGATIFPHNINLGQTGNADLVERIGEITAKEMLATGTNWNFSPTLGQAEDERWGRMYECFSEEIDDITLLTSAYIKGLESEGVSATAKHFIAEGQTTNGVNQGDTVLTDEEYDAVIDELAIPYVEAIKNDVDTIMVSYNSINGEKMHGNHELLTTYLKGELGFDGIIISDYNGVDQIEDTSSYKEQLIEGVNAGIDVLMVAGDHDGEKKWLVAYELLNEAVAEGSISEDRIDDAVYRILTVKVEKGLIDDMSLAYGDTALLETVGSEEHREVARQAVSESMVLLKNTETTSGSTIVNDLKDMDKLIVAGAAGHDIGIQSGGWTISWQGSVGDITEGTTIYEGLKEVGTGKTIDYAANGYFDDEGYEAAIVVVGEDPYAESFGDKSASALKLDSSDVALINSIEKDHPELPIVLLVVAGRPITIADQVEQADAIVMVGLPGSEGAGIADVLLGDKDFTGSLTFTWPWYAQDIESKFTDDSTVLYPYGHGLTKMTTGSDTEKPTDPSLITLSKDTPTVVEAENFVAKHSELVVSGNGQFLEYIREGRYVEYLINIPENGTYKMSSSIATTHDNKEVAFDIEIDGAVYGSVSNVINNTGWWDQFKDLELGNIYLPAGTHTVRVALKGADFNINSYTFEYVNDEYVEPEKPVDEENVGTGNIISEEAVYVSMSSSESSQSKDWYKGEMKIENKNSEKESLDIRNVDDSSMTTIVVNDEVEYQAMLGNGVSLEESTINNLLKMDDETREEFLRYLIDPENGMGNTLIRLTVASSDFTSQEFYSYYDGSGTELDGEPDWYNKTGNGFSIQKDIDTGVIQVVNELQVIAKELGVEEDIKFFASSWSPPGWMKTSTDSSNSYPNNDLLLKGGAFNSEYADELATYFVRFVEEYSKHGIEFHAVTLQNEPVLEINYPSCYMTGDQQALVAKAFKEQIAASDVLTDEQKDIAVWTFDHNFDGAEKFMADLEAAGGLDYIDGIAFHPYGGDASTMGAMYQKYEDLSMHLTERSVWGTSGANSIITWYRNGSQSYNSWVTMLDSNINTHQWVGTPDPTLFVQDANDTNNYWATPEVYIMSQFTKYIKDGYVRVDSNNGDESTVTNVTYKNPETGELVMVVTNTSGKEQDFKVVNNGTQFNATLPAGNVATYVWQPVDATSYKNITDNLTLTDANIKNGTLMSNGDAEADKTVEGLSADSVISYTVNVQEAGTYKVELELTSHGAWEDALSLAYIMQNGEVLGQVNTNRYIWWGEEKTDYRTYQTYVTFATSGIQTIDITFENSNSNYKDITFTKESNITSIPGKLDTTNHIDQYGLVKETKEGIYNFGFIHENDYVTYDVSVLEAGEYNVYIDAATGSNDKTIDIIGINADGEELMVHPVTISQTANSDTFGMTDTTVELTTDIVKLKVKFNQNDDLNYRGITIGNNIVVTQDEITEGTIDGSKFTITLGQEKFIETIDPSKIVVEAPTGVVYTVEKLDDNTVEVTLNGEASYDFDKDQVVKVSVDSSQYGSASATVVEDDLVITAVDDEETLEMSDTVAYGTKNVEINLVGGTYAGDLSDKITLSGDIAKYVQIKSVTRTSSTKAEVELEWSPMYTNISGTFTLASEGYSDSSLALTKAVIFEGTTDLPEAIDITDDVVTLTEDMAYRFKGSLTNKDETATGNYIDFFVDVKEAGTYELAYKVETTDYKAGALKVSGGAGLATDNLGSVTYPNTYGEREHSIFLNLNEGKQTIRLEATAVAFSIDELSLSKVTTVVVDGNTSISHDDMYNGSMDKTWLDEGDNIGFQEVGTFQEYKIDVKTAGEYELRVNAATDTNAAQAKLSLTTNTRSSTELGTVEVEKNGWSNYVLTDAVTVSLPVGVHTIRIAVEGDGFNYKGLELNLTRAFDTTAPTIEASSTTVYVNNKDSISDIIGLNVTDNIEGDILNKAIISTTYNNMVAGIYDVTIDVQDADGNMAQKTVQIEVVEPAKMLVENNNYTVGDTFDPLAGITISDVDGTDITSKTVILENLVDMTKAGTYVVTYQVTDALGTVTTFTRSVVVAEKATVDPERPTNPEVPTNPEAPDEIPGETGDVVIPGVQTGDNTNIILFASVAIITLLAITLVLKKRED